MPNSVQIGYANNFAVGFSSITCQIQLSGDSFQGTPLWLPNNKYNNSSIQASQNLYINTGNSTTTVAVPEGAAGVIINPTSGGATNNTLIISQHDTDTGININPLAYSDVCFDPNNLPANLYLKSDSEFATLVQLYWY